MAKGNPGKAECGGIIRDHARNTIDAIAIPIGILTSHRVEATAALYTMKVAMEIGYQFLWLEGDSLNIINMLNDKKPSTWTIEDNIMEIKALTTNFKKVIFSHSYREGNMVADWIANRVVQGGSMMRWHYDLRNNVDLNFLIKYDSTHAMEGKIWQD